MAQREQRPQHRRVLAHRCGLLAVPEAGQAEQHRDHGDHGPCHPPGCARMQREAGHRRPEDRARVEQPVETHEVTRSRTESRGREDVDDDVDESASRGREHERDREQCVAGRGGFGSEQHAPEDQRARERDTCAPAIGQHAADRVDCRRRDDTDRDRARPARHRRDETCARRRRPRRPTRPRTRRTTRTTPRSAAMIRPARIDARHCAPPSASPRSSGSPGSRATRRS